jgi:hypothetical protein
LVERFNYDPENLVKTLEAINEEEVIRKYELLKDVSGGKLQLIQTIVYDNYDLSLNCQKKLTIILLCYEKNITTVFGISIVVIRNLCGILF